VFGFGKKTKKALLQLFFATDVHGSDVVFRKFINAGKFYGCEHLILGGDITGKLLIPIIEEDGKYRTTVQENTLEMHSKSEVDNVIKRIETQGFYWQIITPDVLSELQNSPEKREELFLKLARERLEKWLEMADDRLRGTNIRCYITGGNDDSPEVLETLYSYRSENIIANEGEIVAIDASHSMFGLGYSNPTPWATPREVSEEELESLLEKGLGKVNDFTNSIWNIHVPPKDCTLDTCPRLDTSTDPPTPVMAAGQPVMFGAGSVAVRKAIEKYQPLLVLTGHIHESKGVVKLKRSTVINPGSEYGEGVLHGVIVNVGEGEVVGYQMTSG
jgi:Icc-related predicted phosphoesterase